MTTDSRRQSAFAWRIADGHLCAPDGRVALLRGLNLANAHKTPPYFGFHRFVDFRRVRDDWGMNALRLLVTWAAIEPERGQIDHGYLAELALRLDWAARAGLWVVLDMHQDLYGEGFGGNGAPRWTQDPARYRDYRPTEPWFMNYLEPNLVACVDRFWSDAELKRHYIEAWCCLARRFADHPAVVGFDLMNEPFWGTTEVTHFEREVLTTFYECLVREVRQHAPGWLAFVEPSASRNLGVPCALSRPGFDNLVYAPHAYDLGAEAGHGFQLERRGDLLENLAALGREARQLGAPLCIGEYGGNAKHPGIFEYMDTQYTGIANVLGSSMLWAYDRDDGYGLLDSAGREKPELLAAVLRPYPEFVAGTPLRIRFDARERSFEFAWQGNDRSGGVTEVSVPRACYPDGYHAELRGAELETRATRVLIRGAKEDREFELRIVPR